LEIFELNSFILPEAVSLRDLIAVLKLSFDSRVPRCQCLPSSARRKMTIKTAHTIFIKHTHFDFEKKKYKFKEKQVSKKNLFKWLFSMLFLRLIKMVVEELIKFLF